MTIEGRPVLSDKTYKKYVLEHLENWVLDAIGTDEVTAKEVYDVLIKALDENVEHHRKELDKNVELLSLMRGYRSVDLGDGPYDGWDSQYTEEELDAMCEAAVEKEKCREYNLREAEYYNKRAVLDAEYAKMQKESCDY